MKMKNQKIKKSVRLLLIMLLCVTFYYCDKEDVNIKNIDNETFKTVLQEIDTRLNGDGSLINSEQRPSNILFDIGLNFVYPIEVVFNNNDVVTINSLSSLNEHLKNSTNSYYIEDINYPFQIEKYNKVTQSVEQDVIDNEEDFESATLFNECNYTFEYAPVCVEVMNNETFFVVRFPNEGAASCAGYLASDYIDCSSGMNIGMVLNIDCFEFVYPISIVVDSGDTIEIDSNAQLELELYSNYGFELVYPFNIHISENTGNTIINSAGEFLDLAQCN